MVKIPGLEDLKKMGADLIDSAKSVNIGETVDKLKSKMEAISGKREVVIPAGDNPVQQMLAGVMTALNELAAAQAVQVDTIKKIQHQLADLAKVIEMNSVKAPTQPEVKQEDIKK
jgi:hypothetical protein